MGYVIPEIFHIIKNAWKLHRGFLDVMVNIKIIGKTRSKLLVGTSYQIYREANKGLFNKMAAIRHEKIACMEVTHFRYTPKNVVWCLIKANWLK